MMKLLKKIYRFVIGLLPQKIQHSLWRVQVLVEMSYHNKKFPSCKQIFVEMMIPFNPQIERKMEVKAQKNKMIRLLKTLKPLKANPSVANTPSAPRPHTSCALCSTELTQGGTILSRGELAEIELTLSEIAIKANNTPQYIVSLTTFGHRVSHTAPFTIISLLNQSIRPDRIILWLAHGEKVPKLLKRLQKYGVEIRFCEDIRSFKKHLPTIELCPNDYVISADDDVYYPHDWFQIFFEESQKNPNKILCHRAHGIRVDENHIPISYFDWDWRIVPSVYLIDHVPESVFPVGCCGILYPPGCFTKEFFNREIFMKLTPFSDDTWCWAMAVINQEYFKGESPYKVLEYGFIKPELVDQLEEANEHALGMINSATDRKTKQIKAVIEHYPQIKDILRKI